MITKKTSKFAGQDLKKTVLLFLDVIGENRQKNICLQEVENNLHKHTYFI